MEMKKEEEEGGSYSMNKTNSDENIREDEEEEEEDNITNLKEESEAWGTWEELLLACAVKRHGFSDWDSVAMEVRSRSSVSAVFVSADNCRDKYRDLKNRFQESAAGESEAVAAEAEVEESIDNIPWLEELRRLRVAELRREVERYDVSILSLQSKVKKLEEEGEGDQKPDLEEEGKGERSGNEASESGHREKVVSTTENSDRSINESNSTASGGKTEEPSQTRDNNPDPDLNVEETEEGGSKLSQSDELGESGTSERKWKSERRRKRGGENKSAASNSQPLIGILDLIRSHPRGSLFERRLRRQDTKDYKGLVKQHMDIETIQKKLKKGSYESSSLAFYRDLQLLFTNVIVFFPSSSTESIAAHELRTVVFEEMWKETGKSAPRLINQETNIKAGAETSDSSLSRQKSLALVGCKRRRFVSAKASPSSSNFSQKEDLKEETLSEEKENIVATGVRSSRRAKKAVATAAVSAKNTKPSKGKSKQKQAESKTDDNIDNGSKQEKEKKVVSADRKKSVADFLKRLKNSPQKESEDQNKSDGNGKKESKTKPRQLRSNSVGKKKAEAETTQVKKSPRRPQKKTAEATAASGKRGRESGSAGKDNKKPKKRSRR